MKTFLRNIFTVICFFAMTVSFTSCLDTGNDPENYYYYSAGGEISSTSVSFDAFDALFIIPEYNEAIMRLFAGKSYVLGQHDSKVIEVCDEVYKRHKAKQAPLQGTVVIERSKFDFNGELFDTVVIKEYKYGK